MKCFRRGHRLFKYTRQSFVRPKYLFSAVADNVVEERISCARCDLFDFPWVEISRRSIQSLSMPSKDMDEFYDKGRIVMSLVKKRVKHT